MARKTKLRKWIDDYELLECNPKDAVFIMNDGTCISQYDSSYDPLCPSRTVDHGCIFGLSKYDRYLEDNVWSKVHMELNFLRVCPETKAILKCVQQKITQPQKFIVWYLINECGYEIEDYCSIEKEY